MTSREAIAMLNVLSSYETKKEEREEYKKCIYAILKDLEILEILKKQITVIENRSETAFGNYTTSYDLNITVDGLDFIQFDKIREWLKK